MIPDEAVEAAAQALWTPSNEGDTWESEYEPYKEHTRAEAKRALEVAAPHLLAHEREQTRLAHLDAMVNRETKRAELEAAWNDGHLMGWNEATANTLPERDSLWRNPYRKPDDA